MLMIGVMPAARADEQDILAGSGSGRVNMPSTSPSRTTSPGWSLLHEVRRDDAAVDQLGGDR